MRHEQIFVIVKISFKIPITRYLLIIVVLIISVVVEVLGNSIQNDKWHKSTFFKTKSLQTPYHLDIIVDSYSEFHVHLDILLLFFFHLDKCIENPTMTFYILPGTYVTKYRYVIYRRGGECLRIRLKIGFLFHFFCV